MLNWWRYRRRQKRYTQLAALPVDGLESGTDLDIALEFEFSGGFAAHRYKDLLLQAFMNGHHAVTFRWIEASLKESNDTAKETVLSRLDSEIVFAFFERQNSTPARAGTYERQLANALAHWLDEGLGSEASKTERANWLRTFLTSNDASANDPVFGLSQGDCSYPAQLMFSIADDYWSAGFIVDGSLGEHSARQLLRGYTSLEQLKAVHREISDQTLRSYCAGRVREYTTLQRLLESMRPADANFIELCKRAAGEFWRHIGKSFDYAYSTTEDLYANLLLHKYVGLESWDPMPLQKIPINSLAQGQVSSRIRIAGLSFDGEILFFDPGFNNFCIVAKRPDGGFYFWDIDWKLGP